jgi:hypothetical protein
MNPRLADSLERVAWTAAEAAVGVLTVEQFDLPQAWVPVIAVVLAALKAFVAGKVGNTSTASTLPASYDPAS